MAYTRNATWADYLAGGTLVTAAKLNIIEDGLVTAAAVADAANAKVRYPAALYNTAIGTGAAFTLTTGVQNLAIGTNALYYSNGNYNVAIGVNALFYSTADQNTAIGEAAVQAITTGAGNTGIGIAVMHEVSGASDYNTAVGRYALYGGLTFAPVVSLNTAVGDQALRYVLTGASYNTAVGASALTGSGATGLTGVYNVGIGYVVATALTTGTRNIGIGNQSLNALTSGGSNVAIGGYRTGAAITTGAHNTFIGSEAGSVASGQTASVDYGVAIGRYAATTISNMSVIGSPLSGFELSLGLNTTNVLGSLGAGVFAIRNVITVPTANPTGGGVLWVEAGALKYRGTAGTVTTVAPA